MSGLQACGSDDQQQQVGAGAGQQAPSDPPPSSSTTPSTDDLPPVPPIVDVEKQLQNDNTKDDGLGTVCWARWEIARQIIRSTQPDMFLDAVSQLLAALPDIDSELAKPLDPLPEGVPVFVERLRIAVDEAVDIAQDVGGKPEDVLEAITSQFEFESYPGITDYLAAAKDHKACARA